LIDGETINLKYALDGTHMKLYATKNGPLSYVVKGVAVDTPARGFHHQYNIKWIIDDKKITDESTGMMFMSDEQVNKNIQN